MLTARTEERNYSSVNIKLCSFTQLRPAARLADPNFPLKAFSPYPELLDAYKTSRDAVRRRNGQTDQGLLHAHKFSSTFSARS